MDQDLPVGENALAPEPEAPEAFVARVTKSANLAADMAEAELRPIARQVTEDYSLDFNSTADWRAAMDRGIKLAKLVKDEKTYPFKRAANIKYPLVTSAAAQFNARAYPAIVPADKVVVAQTFGKDPQGVKAARGERVAAHMSWQLLSQMPEWEEDTDKLLMQLPIVGTMYRKVWYDPVAKRPRSRLLEPGAFVVNDKVKSLEDAPRCSEVIALYPAEIETRIRSGQFVEFERQAGTEDRQAAHEFIEQHCRIDLDADGYDEPYIVTVHRETETVVRLVADFEPEDVAYTSEARQEPQMTVDAFGVPTVTMERREVVTGIAAIRRGSYFVDYKLMPGIDGGFHGTGLGILLGDISDAANSIINMLLDAGHMAALGGGFIGSEFRIKGGHTRFEPGEWKMVQATGNELRNSLVPMTFPGPDAVLFQMLGMLIDAGREISSTKDIMTGDNGGKVQTATTTMALIEQGLMLFSASYKRIFRSLKREYKLLAKINARTVTPEEYNRFHDEVDQQGQPVMHDPAKDYGAADMDIAPSADPRSVTKMQEMAKAELLSQMAMNGLVDPQAAGQRILDAAEISDTEALVPKPDPMQAQMAQFQTQMTVEMAKADLSQRLVDIEFTLAKIEGERADAIKTMTEADAFQAGQRLNELAMMMKDRRSGIEQALKFGLGGMAGQSGNPGGASGVGGQLGAATGGRNPILLGGAGLVGSGPGGAGQGFGVA